MSVARSESVQPSLWDRLVNDLPGLVADIDALREDLADALGGEANIEALMEGGLSALHRRTDLDEGTWQLARALLTKAEQRARLEARGVVVTAEVLREAVRRDIEMLFNVERLESGLTMTDKEAREHDTMEERLADFPHVRRSVVNYGVPSFAGRKGSDFDRDALTRSLAEALRVHEPRLKEDTIKVDVSYADKVGMRVSIDAVLLLSPVPERLRLSTTIDLESGRAVTRREEV